MIKLHFLGLGGAFFPELGNTSAWFEYGGGFFLLDCGADVFRKVYGLSEYRRAEKLFVVVTHMHGDHVGSLGQLAAYSRHCLKKKLTIIYPDQRIRQYLKLCGIYEDGYRHIAGSFSGEGVEIEPVPVIHASGMGCYGYRIGDDKERIFYSGDGRLAGDDILGQLESGVLKRLYLDTAKFAAPDSNHGSFEALKQKVDPKLRGEVVCMHLDCDFRREIREAGFLCAGDDDSRGQRAR